jgi:hypothetical protein
MHRASLGLSQGGAPLLDFRDDSGRSRVFLTVDTKGQGLAFTNGDGRPQAVMSVDQDGSRVIVHDEQGNGRGVLATTKDGPAFMLSDPGERPRVAIYARTGGANGLSLVESSGTTRGQLVLDRDGPRLDLMDPGGDDEQNCTCRTILIPRLLPSRTRVGDSMAPLPKCPPGSVS